MTKPLTDAEAESLANRKGLVASKVTMPHIKSLIADIQYHQFTGTQLTVCCLTLSNGFNVTGESACASHENFDQEIGEGIALTNAINKIWQLEGYLLKQSLYEGTQ